MRWFVYSGSFSGESLGPAPKEKGDTNDAKTTRTKDRKRFKQTFIGSLLFERLSGAVRNFVRNGKERLFCEISDKNIGNVSGVPRGNMPAFASS
jgi:hypothetical protein